MTQHHVVALLERGSPCSLGMLGVIVQDELGGLRTNGVLGPDAGPVGEMELAGLIASGQASRVKGPILTDAESQISALWMGDEFVRAAAEIDLPLPPIPRRRFGRLADGAFWIAAPEHVYAVMDSWIERAYRRVLRTREQSVASLMKWVMPERIETRAAHFYASDGATQEKDLQWWSRLEAAHGNKVTTQTIADSLTAAINDAKTTPRRNVTGFAAAAKGGDSDVAEAVIGTRSLKGLGFGRWLKRQDAAHPAGSEPLRLRLQRIGSEAIERDGGLLLCLNLLRESGVRATDEFVIDGIRHVDVLESLRCLVGEDRFELVYVEKPREERRRLLIEEEHLTAELADQALDDVTEIQIPEVKVRARFILNGMQSSVLEEAAKVVARK